MTQADTGRSPGATHGVVTGVRDPGGLADRLASLRASRSEEPAAPASVTLEDLHARVAELSTAQRSNATSLTDGLEALAERVTHLQGELASYPTMAAEAASPAASPESVAQVEQVLVDLVDTQARGTDALASALADTLTNVSALRADAEVVAAGLSEVLAGLAFVTSAVSEQAAALETLRAELVASQAAAVDGLRHDLAAALAEQSEATVGLERRMAERVDEAAVAVVQALLGG